MDATTGDTSPAHSEVPPWLALPADWPVIDQAVLDRAVAVSLEALSTETADPAHERLVRYYDRDSKNAATTFLDLPPRKRRGIGAGDILATSLLDETFDPAVVRRLLEPGPVRTEVTTALRALPDAMLATADTDALEAMGTFYRTVLAAVTPPGERSEDHWVVASKLCARKRPDLFPVRDDGVRELFGTADLGDHRADWQAFRHVIGNHEVVQAIDRLQAATLALVEGTDTRIDASRLRLLDVALWTFRWSTSHEPREHRRTPNA